MAIVSFVSGFTPILKNDGNVNASGTLEFYSPGTAFATTKAVYSDASLATSLGVAPELDSAGRKAIFLDGNYDLKIKDSAGSLITTLYNINPDTTSSSTDPNLLINGSFENSSAGVPADWTLVEWNSGANVVDSSVQYHGKYSMKFVSTGSGGGHITTTAFFPVSLGRTLTLKFAYKSSVADVRNVVEVLWYDKDQVAFSTPSSTIMDDSTTNPTSFTQKTYKVSPLSGTYFAKLKITGCHSSDATSGSTWYDGVSLVEDALDITNQTAETSVAITDELLLYDASATENNKITVNDLFKAVNGFTEDTSPDESADFVLTYDTSGTDVKKVKPINLASWDYESSETALGAAGTKTEVAHGLTTVPKAYQIVLRCKTTDIGWAVDDEVDVNSLVSTDQNMYTAPYVNATYIGFIAGTGINYSLPNKGTFAVGSAITAASWKLVFRARKN